MEIRCTKMYTEERWQMFSDYISRCCYKRKELFKGISARTYYRRLKNPEELTISELRWLMKVGEMDSDKVMNFILKGERQ